MLGTCLPTLRLLVLCAVIEGDVGHMHRWVRNVYKFESEHRQPGSLTNSSGSGLFKTEHLFDSYGWHHHLSKVHRPAVAHRLEMCHVECMIRTTQTLAMTEPGRASRRPAINWLGNFRPSLPAPCFLPDTGCRVDSAATHSKQRVGTRATRHSNPAFARASRKAVEEKSNHQLQKLEGVLTHCKQRTAIRSNRQFSEGSERSIKVKN
jgi:hypothetical protein